MLIELTEIPDVKIVVPRRLSDDRGFFSEVFSARAFGDVESQPFVQDNHSWSAHRFTIRGLHFQATPRAQGKLIRVARGRVLDVAVDLRRSSATFGKHVAVELSAANWHQLWVPIGFAHGFCTLEPDSEVLYKVTEYYSAEYDFGLAFDDPDLGIEWPVSPDQAILSDKDRKHPRLTTLPQTFD